MHGSELGFGTTVVPSLATKGTRVRASGCSAREVTSERRYHGFIAFWGLALYQTNQPNAIARKRLPLHKRFLRNSDSQTPAEPEPDAQPNEGEKLVDPKPLRTLASLKWPYVPEPPSFVDPVTKNDPKPLALTQYEAIATSPDVRRVISDNPNIPNLLRSVDKLYGPLRQQALEEMLGVGTSGDQQYGTRGQTHETLARIRQDGDAESNMQALRQLSEAIEKAIGVGDAQRGLAWEDG
ncbi:hypothetical protein FRC10_011245 [Ceratobasidium sp. 414]|nr:hypothetical protein FRC10_011245 [Ceratobasidium sp. 414]